MIQNHPAELSEIHGGGKDSGMTGHSSHAMSHGVMHLALDQTVGSEFRGGDTGTQTLLR